MRDLIVKSEPLTDIGTNRLVRDALVSVGFIDPAATSSARPTHCIPPWAIGCSTPNISVKRVLIMPSSQRLFENQ